jgi:hypothetical protein
MKQYPALIQAMQQRMPLPAPPQYRLYYDDLGRPITYTTEDLPGNYVVLTVDEYAFASPHVRVKNGKLITVSRRPAEKLISVSDHGQRCHPCDVTVIVSESMPARLWRLQDESTI